MSNQQKLKILNFTPELASTFKQINEEWIRQMFVLEPVDEKVLNNPKLEIIDDGGVILFVGHQQLGVVGTGALIKTGERQYELSKMGVLEKARGLKAGEFLLKALIDKAGELGAEKLYLLTNSKCESAIHLYLKNKFAHDQEIMSKFGCEYSRCDVAMKYVGKL